MIGKQIVSKIARLSRISFTDDELEQFAEQFTSIIGYVEQLNAVDTQGVEPTCGISPERISLRDDEALESLPREDLVANGPSVKDGFFAVPKVIQQ